MDEIPRKLSLSVAVYQRLKKIHWDGEECIGEIERTPENCELISSLLEEELLYPPEENIIIPALGIFGEIQLQPPRNRTVFFAKNFDDLLCRPSNLSSPPDYFFISDSEELYPSFNSNPSTLIKGYLDAVKLIRLLMSFSDYSDASTGHLKLVFLNKEKLEIQVYYEKGQLLPLPCVDDLEILLGENVHQEQRRMILKKLLLEELLSIPVKERFSYLLSRFAQFYNRFLDNYQLYVSEFSFDKIYKEISDKKLEYVLKLNKNFSDIQNQLLAVPLAALLAWAQMAPNSDTKNFLVNLTSIIFAIFMSMLLRNQRASLEAIHQEIASQHEILKREHAALAHRFENIYEDMIDRYCKHKLLLRLVDLAVAVIIVVAPTLLFYIYTLRELASFWARSA